MSNLKNASSLIPFLQIHVSIKSGKRPPESSNWRRSAAGAALVGSADRFALNLTECDAICRWSRFRAECADVQTGHNTGGGGGSCFAT